MIFIATRTRAIMSNSTIPCLGCDFFSSSFPFKSMCISNVLLIQLVRTLARAILISDQFFFSSHRVLDFSSFLHHFSTANQHPHMPHINMSTTAAIDEFKAILSEEVPLCTGTIPLGTNISRLFYRNAADGSSGY